MGEYIVIIGAVLLISAIVWWFFGKHTQTTGHAHIVEGVQQVDIRVDGGYVPNTVVLRQGIPARIVFNRKDPSSCLSHVVFPYFGIDEELPLGKSHVVSIDTTKTGNYEYACGMNMFHGTVIIEK